MPFQKNVRAWRVGVPDSPSSGLLVPPGASPDLGSLLSQGETEAWGPLEGWAPLNLTARGFPISPGNLTAFAREPLKNGYRRRRREGVKKRKRSVCSLISQHMASALCPSRTHELAMCTTASVERLTQEGIWICNLFLSNAFSSLSTATDRKQSLSS